MSENSEIIEVSLENLIETVREQGCVKLKNGLEGIPRNVTYTSEGETIDVDTDDGNYHVVIEEIEKIIFIG